jgi:hypothetical protein
MIMAIFVRLLCDFYCFNLVIFQCLSYTLKRKQSCIEDLEVIGELINYKAHVFFTIMLKDKHRLSLGMVIHVKYIHDHCSLLSHILSYLIVL